MTIVDAFRGIIAPIFAERNYKYYILVSALVLALGWYKQIQLQEYLFLVLSICSVYAFELLNSCIERLCNIAQPNYDSEIGYIKDAAAGATLMMVIFSASVALIILF
jgi:diacylglycerol kinase